MVPYFVASNLVITERILDALTVTEKLRIRGLLFQNICCLYFPRSFGHITEPTVKLDDPFSQLFQAFSTVSLPLCYCVKKAGNTL